MITLRLARALLLLAAPLVPSDSRRVWRDQWIADLTHYDQWLARERHGAAARAWLGAPRAPSAPCPMPAASPALLESAHAHS